MIEREWREASDMRKSVVVLGLVMLVAAVLRFWGLSSGLPYMLGVDEPEVMVRAVNMLKTGDYHPHFFDYPTLYIYVQTAVAALQFLAGATSGRWASLSQVSQYDFYLWGRAVTAALGTATVYLVYLAASRWGTRHALVAATLFAVVPFHVRESHFVLTDVPMTFFVVLAFVLSLRAHERGTPGAFAWAGVAAGLAAGTKYTGSVAIALPLVAALMTPGEGRARVGGALAAIGAFLAAFVVAAPYTLLDLPGFLNGYAHLSSTTPHRVAGAGSGFLVYFKHLRNGMGWPALILAAAGAVLFLMRALRGPGRARFAMVLVFVPAFFWVISGRVLTYARYMMPALPFVCLLAAVAVVSGVTLLRRVEASRALRTWLMLGLTVAAAVQPAYTALGFVRNAGRTWTYGLACDWLETHARPGARVVHEIASFHLPEPRYKVEPVRTLLAHDVEYYQKSGTDYVVASSEVFGKSFGDPQRFGPEYLAYRNLFDHLALAATVTPTPGHPGPELRIFAVPR